MSQRQPRHPSEADTIVVWVAILERGRRTKDFELIRRANEELDRLGVFICIGGQKYGRTLASPAGAGGPEGRGES